MNWQYLSLLWDDSPITTLLEGNKELKEDINMYIEDLKIAKQEIDKLTKKEQEHSNCVVSELEIGTPTTRDKPSSDSSLTFKQTIKIAELIRTTATNYTKNANKWFTITNTNSMEPFIDANTITVAEKINDDTILKVGHIVIYDGTGSKNQVNKSLVMHRIKKIEGNKYYIKGDNNILSDGWVNKKYLLWKPYAFINATKQPIQGSDD